jgi:hypothetical protein
MTQTESLANESVCSILSNTCVGAATPRKQSGYSGYSTGARTHFSPQRCLMAMPWFRLYAEFATDQKVQTLSEKDQRRFIMLLCLKCSGDLDNLIKLSSDIEQDLARVFSLQKRDVICTKSAFISRGMIDENWDISKWIKRQYEDKSANRVARHRASQRNVTEDVTGNVTEDVTGGDRYGNDDVTESPRARGTDTDTDTDNPLYPQGGQVSDASVPLIEEKQTEPNEKKKEQDTAHQKEAEEFYKAYPKHVNHKDTLDKYSSLSKQKKLPEHTELMEALDRHKDYWLTTGTEMQFIPAPNVWLNKRRWEDELLTRPTTQPSFLPSKSDEDEKAARKYENSQRMLEADRKKEEELANDPRRAEIVAENLARRAARNAKVVSNA